MQKRIDIAHEHFLLCMQQMSKYLDGFAREQHTNIFHYVCNKLNWDALGGLRFFNPGGIVELS